MASDKERVAELERKLAEMTAERDAAQAAVHANPNTGAVAPNRSSATLAPQNEQILQNAALLPLVFCQHSGGLDHDTLRKSVLQVNNIELHDKWQHEFKTGGASIVCFIPTKAFPTIRQPQFDVAGKPVLCFTINHELMPQDFHAVAGQAFGGQMPVFKRGAQLTTDQIRKLSQVIDDVGVATQLNERIKGYGILYRFWHSQLREMTVGVLDMAGSACFGDDWCIPVLWKKLEISGKLGLDEKKIEKALEEWGIPKDIQSWLKNGFIKKFGLDDTDEKVVNRRIQNITAGLWAIGKSLWDIRSAMSKISELKNAQAKIIRQHKLTLEMHLSNFLHGLADLQTTLENGNEIERLLSKLEVCSRLLEAAIGAITAAMVDLQAHILNCEEFKKVLKGQQISHGMGAVVGAGLIIWKLYNRNFEASDWFRVGGATAEAAALWKATSVLQELGVLVENAKQCQGMLDRIRKLLSQEDEAGKEGEQKAAIGLKQIFTKIKQQYVQGKADDEDHVKMLWLRPIQFSHRVLKEEYAKLETFLKQNS